VIVLVSNWERSNGKRFLSHDLQFAPQLEEGTRVYVSLKSDNESQPIIVPDYFWSKDTYLALLAGSGFGGFEVHEPVATGPDGGWMDEERFPPFLIIKATKEQTK
jgi:hypothetical protein